MIKGDSAFRLVPLPIVPLPPAWLLEPPFSVCEPPPPVPLADPLPAPVLEPVAALLLLLLALEEEDARSWAAEEPPPRSDEFPLAWIRPSELE